MNRQVVWTLDREGYERLGYSDPNYWLDSRHLERCEDGVNRLVFREAWEYELATEEPALLMLMARRAHRPNLRGGLLESKCEGFPLTPLEVRAVFAKVKEARNAPPPEPEPPELRARFWER